MQPYLAYTCGINYENEMRDIPVTMSASKDSEACCDEECGWFEVLVEPIKVIPARDLPYLCEHDSDRAVIDARHNKPGRMMVSPLGEPYVLAPADLVRDNEDWYGLSANETAVWSCRLFL
jgi:hypothetical protein